MGVVARDVGAACGMLTARGVATVRRVECVRVGDAGEVNGVEGTKGWNESLHVNVSEVAAEADGRLGEPPWFVVRVFVKYYYCD